MPRIGRTGRAGAKGTAYTFVDAAEDRRVAPELVKVLKGSGQPVPPELARLAQEARPLELQWTLDTQPDGGKLVCIELPKRAIGLGGALFTSLTVGGAAVEDAPGLVSARA